ncbi:MAG TPA: hypothetical protein VHC69_25940 [Polyangiaceae bacterium]|nr:hypothetical protein [Polyangiaceae bacterium]
MSSRQPAPLVALGLLTLGELGLLQRILFADPREYGFVLESVRGVLAGTPVSKSWAHRLLAPALVRALEPLAGGPLGALRAFTFGTVTAANVLLFVLLRKSGVDAWRSLAVCAAYVVARLLLTYRLEYPWDEVDAILFLLFAHSVVRGRSLVPGALLLVGLFNHETALLFPLWYMLVPLERPRPDTAPRELALGSAALVAGGAVIALLRGARYVGRPKLSGQVFEAATPVVENHLHVSHNLHQLVYADWTHARRFIGTTFFVALVALVTLIFRSKDVRAAVWSLAFLSTVVAFGYVNETRHYLPLLSFWAVYWAARKYAAVEHSSLPA